MPFFMIRNDITKLKQVDAIVNPANPDLLEGSGTSCAIYQAAGEEKLAEACEKIGHCDLGKAAITPAFDLTRNQVRFIIHAVVPSFDDGFSNGDEVLYSAYRESMLLAGKQGCESIAFPLLASGNMGYPKENAMRVAHRAIHDFIYEHDMMVYLVLYDEQSVKASRKWIPDLQQYIDDHYVAEKNENIPDDICGNILADELDQRRNIRCDVSLDTADFDENLQSPQPQYSPSNASRAPKNPNSPLGKAGDFEAPSPKGRQLSQKARQEKNAVKGAPKKAPAKRSLKDLLNRKPETFHEMVLRLVKRSKYTAPEIQLRANMSKSTFSKIKVNPDYLPKKGTILSLAVALELSLDETVDLLSRAGYAFSACSRTDIIVQYFIENGHYDIFDINDTLFDNGEPCLGQKMD